MSIRGTAGYHLSGQNAGFNPGAGPSRSDATNDPSPLDAIREQTSKIEDWLDSLSEPIKPYLPAIGRFLIVVTFLEDALRILTQWTDQLVYLHDYRHSKFCLFFRGRCSGRTCLEEDDGRVQEEDDIYEHGYTKRAGSTRWTNC